MDSPLIRGLTTLANLIMLNWLFLLCSIPLVTIGASLTALHHVTLRMIRGDGTSVVKPFLAAFRDNFKQATGIWLALAAAGGLLAADYAIGLRMVTGGLRTLVLCSVVLLTAIWVIVWLYVFPLQARYENSVGRTMKNAFMIGLSNLPCTLALAVVALAIPYLSYKIEGLISIFIVLSVLFLFSGITYLSDLLIDRVLVKISPEERHLQEERE